MVDCWQHAESDGLYLTSAVGQQAFAAQNGGMKWWQLANGIWLSTIFVPHNRVSSAVLASLIHHSQSRHHCKQATTGRLIKASFIHH